MKDRYGRTVDYLRLSVTELCNLRCQYCMPENGICKKNHEEILTEEEMIMAVTAAAELGIRKLRITGGEPLVKKNILSICEHCSEIPGIEEICMTTNGTLLPGMAQDLRKAGVERLNISLDTLDAEKYTKITRIGRLEEAIAGIESALRAGFKKIKLNAVLIGGFNDSEIPALCEITRKYPIDVRFIELMPMPGNEMLSAKAYLPNTTVPQRVPELQPEDETDGVARLYRYPDGKGRVGLISPISSHFCAECSRLRLTADGNLKPCLHSDDEYCVKGLNAAEMKEKIREAILAKPGKHPALSGGRLAEFGRSMNRIGG